MPSGGRMASVGLKKRSDRHVERFRNAGQVPQRWIPDAALDAPHVGAVHAGFVGESFLRPPFTLTELFESFAKGFSSGLKAFWHADMLGRPPFQNRPTHRSHTNRNVLPGTALYT